jgi:hypothetical protein
MNDDDHQHRRVWWDGHKGGAYFGEVEIYHLPRAPKVTGIKRIVELDYAPKRGAYFVREYRKEGRELTDDERQDIEARLGRMTNGALDALLT